MRVNSEFKDYYDIVMEEGQDQTLVYQRHSRKESLKEYPFHYFSYIPKYGVNYRESPYIGTESYAVGFCGNVYQIVKLINYKDLSKTKFCYSLEDVDSFVEENFPKEVDMYLATGYDRKNDWGNDTRQKNFEKFFKTPEELHKERYWYRGDNQPKCATPEKISKLFEGLTPVFVAHYSPFMEDGKYHSGTIVFNGPLKQVEFFRKFPPYQAFQEINMWLSNQAVPMKPIPEMTDKVKIAAKGFDKHSFRKDKSKK